MDVYGTIVYLVIISRASSIIMRSFVNTILNGGSSCDEIYLYSEISPLVNIDSSIPYVAQAKHDNIKNRSMISVISNRYSECNLSQCCLNSASSLQHMPQVKYPHLPPACIIFLNSAITPLLAAHHFLILYSFFFEPNFCNSNIFSEYFF